jgi:TonB-dependent starch-binding outer membrane protein SusC
MKKSKFMKLVMISLLLSITSYWGYAQTINVTGTITDPGDQPIPGVNVTVVGTNQGTITTLDGTYTIDVPSEGKLEFKFMGYATQIVDVNKQTAINIVLQEGETELEQVVVIGYGTAKKSDLTGAVASANLKDFEKSPNTNLVQSLQGSVPGLNVGQVTSAGSTPTISIRGANTISGNKDILVVIDGVVSGNLSSINPADIESVNILKDASSTSIYGAAASNGVMLITTKKGKSGKPRISLSSSYSFQKATHDYKTMNTAQYIDFLTNLMWTKSYTAASGYTEANPDYIVQNDFPVTSFSANYSNGVDVDWWDLSTQNPFINENRISISGGSDAISYLVSYGNTNQQNMLINDNFKRNSLRLNLDLKLKPWWTMGVQSSASFVNQDGSEPILWILYTMNPLANSHKADNTLNPFPMENANINPLTGNNVNDLERHNYFVGNFYTEFTLPVKGLTYRINYGNNYTQNKHDKSDPYANSLTGEAYKEFSSSYGYTFDNIVNYTRDFGLHSIGATLVYGISKYEYSYSKADATQFTNLVLGYDKLEVGTNKFVFSDANSSSSLYQVARLNYKFNNRYILTSTLRRDGSSSFATNNKTALFPSVSLAWVISEENFFESLLPVVNFLKIRGGYGMTGNRVDNYSSLAKVIPNPGYVFGDGGSAVIRQELNTLENKDLRWEKTGGLNIGLDFRMINDRIQGTLDLYKTKTTDLLYKVSIPTITGFSEIISNVGNLENRGIELTLTSHNIVTKDFEWTTTFNISANENKIVSLTGMDSNNDGKEDDLITSGLFIGESTSAVYGYKIDGIYQVGDTPPTGYYTGNYIIHDESGDGSISVADRTILGKTDPAYRFSIMNKFSYKDFSLSFFINSVQGGNDSYLGENTYNVYPDNTGKGNNHLTEFVKNLYSPATNPSGIYSANQQGGNLVPIRYESRNFVRLQDLTFSYNLPKKLVSHASIESVNIYFSGKNLYTLTNWHGWDPEANSGTITPIGRSSSINKSGSDFEGRPVMKSFTFGIDVTF